MPNPTQNAAGPLFFPTWQDFNAAVANRPGDIEVIRWCLYDSVIYAGAAGQTSLTLFQNPQGQGTSTQSGASAQTKQLGDTNMVQAGMLPNPQAFYIDNIQLDFYPGSTVAGLTDWTQQVPTSFNATAAATVQSGENDVLTAIETGALTLTIGTKPYVQDAPLLRFPPAARFELSAAAGIAGTNAQPAAYGKASAYAGGNLYRLTPGIAIMSGQNFNVNLNWPVAVALPSGKNGKFVCRLDGWLYRGVQ